MQVYAIMGHRLFDFEIRNSKFEIHNSVFPAAGVYILRLGEKTHKIVIR
ncbi:MAG: T9SS type A sorting domain-containing protein [Bacteroidales bacterium]|nr:T9SS type A sorting domain-containing protein [Bacteroidales bacterium]